MKTHVMMKLVGLTLMGVASYCVAAQPQSQETDPSQFMELLDESGPESVEQGQSRTNDLVAQPPGTTGGGQVQRLLEESELILRGIADESAPLRDELQKGYSHALDVIKGYLDRLPKKAAPAPAEIPALEQETEKRVNRDTSPQMETNAVPRVASEPAGIMTGAAPAEAPAVEDNPVSPAALVADADVKARAATALRDAAGKLRESAAFEIQRAEELVRMAKALEETGDE